MIGYAKKIDKAKRISLLIKHYKLLQKIQTNM